VKTGEEIDLSRKENYQRLVVKSVYDLSYEFTPIDLSEFLTKKFVVILIQHVILIGFTDVKINP